MALGANMAPKSFQNGARGVAILLPVFGLGRVLGGSWGLLGPKRPQDLILIDFWFIFDGFWLIFGRFLNDFSMISVMVVTRV